jgi:hypothetical protein
MPCDAFNNMYWCLNFADDFNDKEEWSDIVLDKKHVSLVMAHHWQKFGEVEDAIN